MADSFKVRIPIGLGLIAMISSLCWLDYSTGHGWGALAISLLVVGGGLREFAILGRSSGPVPTLPLIVFGMAYVGVKGLAYELDSRLHLLEAPIAVAFCYFVFFGCLRGAPDQERLRGVAVTALGFVYVPLLGGFAIDARFLEGVGEAAFYYIIAIAKGTDICAYFAGKLFGKTKVIPSVSPGKTVAGFVGAVAGAVGITAVFCVATRFGDWIPLPLAVGVGILMALVVISGDLVESFFKRGAEVKDSANMLPQFGGVLDVVDSILIAAPPVYFLLIAAAWLQGTA